MQKMTLKHFEHMAFTYVLKLQKNVYVKQTLNGF